MIQFEDHPSLRSRLNGCYEALEGGNTAEALIDFTGGVSESLSLDREALSLHSDHRRAFFQTLAKAHDGKALITCSIRVRTLVLEEYNNPEATVLLQVRLCITSVSQQGGKLLNQCWTVA